MGELKKIKYIDPGKWTTPSSLLYSKATSVEQNINQTLTKKIKMIVFILQFVLKLKEPPVNNHKGSP